ncbi:asparagine synthase C-terminal domain-containing protein [Mesotoga sp. UBA5825]|uniref:asparagine synthase C-terminal domain-containing protein n=1 Tax=Mesotoga sp. UBA5825 TaxID=1946858 RepID=UPI0025F81A6A|nr:asparagine synthase C-terminal domain-containing protein [Mesotoga sp. UBA5825]
MTKLLLNEKVWEKEVVDDYCLYRPISMIETEKKPFQQLKNLGLPYVLTRENTDEIVSLEASVGVIRAVPLFYRREREGVTIASSPEMILRTNSEDGESNIDRLSLLEYLSYGYVTSNRTLLEDINGIQSGEVLTVSESGELSVISEYVYDSANIENSTPSEFTAELERVSEKIFTTLVRDLDGRIPVVPLSGGYDSRFIVSMLKLYGLDNVVCLSYSIPGSFESRISKEVAEKLGYKWFFTEYNTKKWVETFQEEDFHDFLNYAHNYTSVSHIQEYPIIRDLVTSTGLKKAGDLVIIPGHTGDFIGGSHIPNLLMSQNNCEANIIESVILKHCNLRNKPANKRLITELSKRLYLIQNISSEGFRVYEIWEWMERQSKFIVNANRIYEYFGYKWALPLWSKEFTGFWSKIPLELKYRKKLYDEFLENKIFNRLGVDIDREERIRKREIELKALDSRRPTLKQRIVNLAKENKFVANLYRSTKRKLKGPSNPCAFDTANPFLLNTAKKRFPRGYQTLEKILKDEFPKGRGGDSNSYVADYIISSILEDNGDIFKWE